MNAHGDTLPHYVTVTACYDENGDELTPDVVFTCPWLYGACHFHPSCGCKSWTSTHYADHGSGHEAEHHERCWMQEWFDNDGHSYAGEDADDMGDYCIPAGMNRSGPIKVAFYEDFIEWKFKENA